MNMNRFLVFKDGLPERFTENLSKLRGVPCELMWQTFFEKFFDLHSNIQLREPVGNNKNYQAFYLIRYEEYIQHEQPTLCNASLVTACLG